VKPRDIIAFWTTAGEMRWFTRDAVFDGELSVRFRGALKEAREGRFDSWAEDPESAIALVIMLDQFPRNIHRGNPLMFAADAKALAVARRSIARGYHQAMPATAARWLIMPFEHAEDLDAQWRGVGLFQAMGLNDMVTWAELHRDIIARFGRFPHRNSILGRQSTPAELAFLAAGGFQG
jgi:uncharacterized protein (DUF924 family)